MSPREEAVLSAERLTSRDYVAAIALAVAAPSLRNKMAWVAALPLVYSIWPLFSTARWLMRYRGADLVGEEYATARRRVWRTLLIWLACFLFLGSMVAVLQIMVSRVPPN